MEPRATTRAFEMHLSFTEIGLHEGLLGAQDADGQSGPGERVPLQQLDG